MTTQLLMIEDDTRLADMVVEYLAQSGMQVDHCGDGRSGLARRLRTGPARVGVAGAAGHARARSACS